MTALPYAVCIDGEPPAEQTHFSDLQAAEVYYHAVVRAVWAGKYTRVQLLRDGDEVSATTRNELKENEDE